MKRITKKQVKDLMKITDKNSLEYRILKIVSTRSMKKNRDEISIYLETVRNTAKEFYKDENTIKFDEALENIINSLTK